MDRHARILASHSQTVSGEAFSMSDEQQTQTTSACPHPEAVGTRWGDPISEERQAELQGYLDRWEAETDHGERKGPFDLGASRTGIPHGVPLTGADVSWLAESGRNAFG